MEAHFTQGIPKFDTPLTPLLTLGDVEIMHCDYCSQDIMII